MECRAWKLKSKCFSYKREKSPAKRGCEKEVFILQEKFERSGYKNLEAKRKKSIPRKRRSTQGPWSSLRLSDKELGVKCERVVSWSLDEDPIISSSEAGLVSGSDI
ncbi:hypothetical protein Tco_0959350 [Tanacetum coccineum]